MSTDESDASRLLSAYARCWNAGDLDRVMAFYAPDAVMMPHGTDLRCGDTAIRTFLAEALPSGPTNLAFEPVSEGSFGSIRYSCGRYSGEVFRAGGERSPRRGTYVVVFRRQADGCWRVILDAFSTIGAEETPDPM